MSHVSSGSAKFSSHHGETISAKKRFSARLRKIRWLIYENIRSRKRCVTRILTRYKKLVKRFLEIFFSKLNPREFSIWKEKLAKTCGDVKAVLEKGKEIKPHVKKPVKDHSNQNINLDDNIY